MMKSINSILLVLPFIIVLVYGCNHTSILYEPYMDIIIPTRFEDNKGGNCSSVDAISYVYPKGYHMLCFEGYGFPLNYTLNAKVITTCDTGNFNVDVGYYLPGGNSTCGNDYDINSFVTESQGQDPEYSFSGTVTIPYENYQPGILVNCFTEDRCQFMITGTICIY